MIASLRNLRIVSMDRPIGLSTVQPPPRVITRGGVREISRNTPRASWKSDPKWISATAEHTTIIDQIKSATNAIAKEELLGTLRNNESYLKTLRRELQGFREGP